MKGNAMYIRTLLKRFGPALVAWMILVAILTLSGCVTIPPEYVIKQNDALNRAQSHIQARNVYDEANDVQPRVATRRAELWASYVSASEDELKRVAAGEMTMEAYMKRALEEAAQDELAVKAYEADLRAPIRDGELAVKELDLLKKENIELAKRFQPLTLN